MLTRIQKRKNISPVFYMCLMSASAWMCFGAHPVLAACVSQGGNQYECSGTETTMQSLSGTGISVTATSDFNLDTTANGSIALHLSVMSGLASFVDHEDTVINGGSRGINFQGNNSATSGLDMTINGSVTASASTGQAIAISNYGAGETGLTINGQIWGRQRGLNINLDTSSSTLNVYSAVDSMISSDTGQAVYIRQLGKESSSVVFDGRVSSSDHWGAYLYNGHASEATHMDFAFNNHVTGGSGLSIVNVAQGSMTGVLGADAILTANNTGIQLDQYGSGTLQMTLDGEVRSQGIGVDLRQSSGNDIGLLHLIVNDEIKAAGHGIAATTSTNTSGELRVEVTKDASVLSQVNSGVLLTRYGGTGDINLLIDGHVQSNSGSSSYAGTYVSNSGAGAIMTTVNGSIQSSGQSNALSIYRAGSGSADVTINGVVTALDTGYGAFVNYRGSGDLALTVSGEVSSRLSHAISYSLDSTASGTATLKTEKDAVVTSGRLYAINVYSSSGKAHLDLDGIIQSNQNSAISIQGGGEVYARINGRVSGVQAGVSVNSSASKMTLMIDKDAEVTASSGAALNLNYYGSDALNVTVAGKLIGQTYGMEMVNQAAQPSEIHIVDGVVEGKSGTAIHVLAHPTYNVRHINISGGRIIGDVVDTNPSLDKTMISINGDFQSEGDFIVSHFNVADGGYFKLGNNDTINSFHTVDVHGVFETAGATTNNMRDMHVHQGGVLRVADTHVLNNGTVFTNDGMLSIGAGAVFKTDTMNAGNGVLSFDIASSGQNGLLEILNGAADLTGQSVRVDLRNVGGITEDDVFHIIHGQSAVIGGPGDVLTPISGNSVLWEFSMVDGTQAGTNENDIFVMAKQKAQPLQLANTTNNQHAAKVLTELQSTTSDPELVRVLSALNSATTEDEFNAVLEATQAAIDAGDSHIAMMQMNRVQNIANLRLENLRFINSDGVGNGLGLVQNNQQITEHGSVWATSFGENAVPNHETINGQRGWGGLAGQYGHQRAQDGIAGYTSRSNGAVFGADSGSAFKDMTLGAAFGASTMRIRSKNVNRAIHKADAYQMTLYGEHRLPYNSYVNAALSYAWGRNKTVRHDVGGVSGLTADGKFDSRQWGAAASFGHHMILGKYILTPSLHADWLRYSADSYRETGAGGAGLHVQSNAVNSVEGGARIKLRREFVTAEKNSILPEIRMGYRYDFSGEELRKNLQFNGGGAAFTVESPEAARHKFSAGTGVVYKDKSGLDFAVHYDLDIEKKFTAHSVGLRATYHF